MRIEEQGEGAGGGPRKLEKPRLPLEAEAVAEEPPVEPVDPPVMDDDLPQLPETD